jgi:hypothetical protein
MAQADAFARIGAWAKQHRTAVLGAGGAGVAGVALLVRHSKGGGAASAAANVPEGLPGTAPATYQDPNAAGFGTPGRALVRQYLEQQQANQSALQDELAQLEKRKTTRQAALKKLIERRRKQRAHEHEQQQKRARTILKFFASRYPPRPIHHPAPHPAPTPVKSPGVGAIVAVRRQRALTPVQRQRLRQHNAKRHA